MSTPNYFYRAYSLGRTHTGMLAYLCDIYNSGKQKPLRDVLNGLGLHELELPPQIGVQFEFKQADLGLFDGDHCFLLIEMKVDDREGWKKANSKDIFDNTEGWYKDLGDIEEGTHYRQTKLYQHRAHQSNLWAMHAEKNGRKSREKYNGKFEPGSSPEVLLVTLGVGECGLMEADIDSDNAAKYIGLELWTSAFAKTLATDPICKQYVDALNGEMSLIEESVKPESWLLKNSANPGSKHPSQRSDIHPAMYRFGFLAAELKKPKAWPNGFGYNPFVTTAGAGDIILQFNYPSESPFAKAYPLYVELSSSGYLSFKLAAVKIENEEKKQTGYLAIQKELAILNEGLKPERGFHLCKATSYRTAKHRTVATWDVGLEKNAQFADETKSVEDVIQNIQAGLELYAELMNRLG